MYRDAINDIYVYNDITIKRINEIKLKYNLVDYQYDSIFIRRGDKLAYESKYIPESEYITLLLNKNPLCKIIFLQTDDYNSYLSLKKYIDENNLRLKIYTLCNKDNVGTVVSNMQKDNIKKSLLSNNDNYLSSISTSLLNSKTVEEMNREEIYNHTLEMIIGIDIVIHSNICICDIQSNVSRFIKLHHKNPKNVYDILNQNYDHDYNKIIFPWNNI
jgi:hypothetical protein